MKVALAGHDIELTSTPWMQRPARARPRGFSLKDLTKCVKSLAGSPAGLYSVALSPCAPKGTTLKGPGLTRPPVSERGAAKSRYSAHAWTSSERQFHRCGSPRGFLRATRRWLMRHGTAPRSITCRSKNGRISRSSRPTPTTDFTPTGTRSTARPLDRAQLRQPSSTSSNSPLKYSS